MKICCCSHSALQAILADNGVQLVSIAVCQYGFNITREDGCNLLHAGQYCRNGCLCHLVITALALIIAANRAFVRGLDFSTGNALSKVKRKRPVQAETIAPVEPKLITIEQWHILHISANCMPMHSRLTMLRH